MSHVAIYLTSMAVGGAQQIARNLAKGLVENGHDVDLVLVQTTGALLDTLPDSVSVINLDASRVGKSIVPLRQYLQEKEPEVLYSMMVEPNIAAIFAHQLARVETRLVISEHNTPTVSTEGIKDQLVLRLASLTYSRADHIVTVSHGVRDDLLKITDLPDRMVTVIYNPIDVNYIRREARELLDHKWFSDPSTQVILSAGRHVSQKGFDTLLRAFALLDDSDSRLVLLGEGEETNSLRELTIELGIEDQVCFPGFVDNPFKYMANADVFVLSSWYEGFGNVLIEAMATGCPVVSTDCPSGPSEILDKGAYGPLVPINNPTEMAEALENVLSNPIDGEILSTRADNFSIETIVKEYEDILFG